MRNPAWRAAACGLTLAAAGLGAAPPVVDHTITLDVIPQGYDDAHCWVLSRAGVIPHPQGGAPTVVMTMQQLWLQGSDVFGPLHDLRSDDLGRNWTGPTAHPAAFDHRREPHDVTVAACDLSPQWHAASGKLLGIGQTVRYRDNVVIAERARADDDAYPRDASRTRRRDVAPRAHAHPRRESARLGRLLP